jgi:ankyrin repeat protein
MLAASKGYDEIVLLLVIKGADLNAVDGRGENASQFARDAGYEHTGSLILKGGVRVRIKGITSQVVLRLRFRPNRFRVVYRPLFTAI